MKWYDKFFKDTVIIVIVKLKSTVGHITFNYIHITLNNILLLS